MIYMYKFLLNILYTCLLYNLYSNNNTAYGQKDNSYKFHNSTIDSFTDIIYHFPSFSFLFLSLLPFPLLSLQLDLATYGNHL